MLSSFFSIFVFSTTFFFSIFVFFNCFLLSSLFLFIFFNCFLRSPLLSFFYSIDFFFLLYFRFFQLLFSFFSIFVYFLQLLSSFFSIFVFFFNYWPFANLFLGPSTSEETASSSSSITVNSLQRTKASIVKASSCEGTKLSSDPVFFVTSEAIKWICEPEESIRALNTWFGEFNMFAQRSQSTARWLMLSYKPWCSPKLLELPHSYDPLFQVIFFIIFLIGNFVLSDTFVCFSGGMSTPWYDTYHIIV